MKSLLTFIVIFGALIFGALWLYLNNYATKAEVFTWEKSYGVKLPLWMKEMPKTTGVVLDMYSEGRAAFTGEVEQWKTTAKDEFNKWLNDTKEEAKTEAKKKANNWIDAQFGSGK